MFEEDVPRWRGCGFAEPIAQNPQITLAIDHRRNLRLDHFAEFSAQDHRDAISCCFQSSLMISIANPGVDNVRLRHLLSLQGFFQILRRAGIVAQTRNDPLTADAPTDRFIGLRSISSNPNALSVLFPGSNEIGKRRSEFSFSITRRAKDSGPRRGWGSRRGRSRCCRRSPQACGR